MNGRAMLLGLALSACASGPRSPEALRDAYRESLQRNNADKAYDLLSKELQAQEGRNEFKRRWEEAYVSMGYAKPAAQPMKLLEHNDQPVPLIMPTSPVKDSRSGNGALNGDGQETPFAMWKRTNVVRQKQAGYATAVVKLFMGDVTADQMLHLADLAERYSNGNLRTTINQNMVIRWVPDSRLGDLYEELAAHGLSDPGAELAEDIIACPGTDTCGLGITSSKGLARALAEVFPAGRVPEDLKDVSVKISGCHNSCAQHHIATIDRYPDVRRRSVMELGDRLHYWTMHPIHVATLALRLFDQTRDRHGLGDREREWLEYGALLHDVGIHISHKGHHRHS